MIMMGKKKEVLSQILGPDGSEAKDEGAEQSALHSCVSELIDAINNKDVEGAVGALKACIAECNAGE